MFDMSEAPCRQEWSNPDDWFAAPRSLATASAKEACLFCPVMRKCADYALEIGIPHGVWGGLDELERRVVWAGNRPTQFDDEVDAALAGAAYYQREAS